MVLRLVGGSYTIRPGRVGNSSRPRAKVVEPDKGSISRLGQKLGIDERAQQCAARFAIESPHPLRLRRRQSEAWHLRVFPLHASQNIIELRLGHRDTSGFFGFARLDFAVAV